MGSCSRCRPALRFVSFDAMNTLIRPVEPAGVTYANMALKKGLVVDPNLLNEAFISYYKRYTSLYPCYGNGKVQAKVAGHSLNSWAYADSRLQVETDSSRDFWIALVEDTFKAVGHSHGFKLDNETLQDLGNDLFNHFTNPNCWQELKGATEILQFLYRKGLQLLIISNWDSRLRDVMQGLGLKQYISAFFLSGELGIEKPDARIFDHAVETMKIHNRQEMLHVGDSLEKDYLASTRSGFRGVLLWPKSDLKRKYTRSTNLPDEDIIDCLLELKRLV